MSHSYKTFMSIALLIAAGCASPVEPSSEVEGQAQALSTIRCPSDVPASLAIPAGNKLVAALDAVGDQIYVCRANATGYGWVFLAPEADLLKPNGNIAGSHYAGPTWEGLDGSTVVGARVAGVSVDASAIPWLLLSAISHTGNGPMSKVTYIQRFDTAGGLAPTAGCDAEHLEQAQGVSYTATYYFYGAGSGPGC